MMRANALSLIWKSEAGDAWSGQNLEIRRAHYREGRSIKGKCRDLGVSRATVREVFEAERATCLVQFDNNRYSARPAPRAVLSRSGLAYGERIEVWYEGRKADEHERIFGRGRTVYGSLHDLPALRRKPGALRNGVQYSPSDTASRTRAGPTYSIGGLVASQSHDQRKWTAPKSA